MTVFFIFEALYARFGEINLESRIFRKQEVVYAPDLQIEEKQLVTTVLNVSYTYIIL